MKFVTEFKEFHKKCADSMLDHISDQPIEGKEKVLRYLKNAEEDGVRCAGIYDHVEKESTMKTIHLYTDGEYYWTSEEIYHFEKYNIPLNKRFLQKVLS